MTAPADAAARGDEVARVRALVAAESAAIERRLYVFDDVVARFCCRGADEVRAHGSIHYATPCHDLATVVAQRLRRAGLRPTLVLCRIRRLFQPVKFQCGIELDLAGEPWYVGFSVTTTRLARGRFVAGKSRTDVLRAPCEAAPEGAPHLAAFGCGSPREVDRLFRGHDLDRHLASYRATTSVRAFERARRRAEEKLGGPDAAELLGPARFVAKGAGDA